MTNVYFELTEAFNARQPTVVLASGQAVVYHRVAIMSKDGDWIIRETFEACDLVLTELATRGAVYRPSAPLDVRWLSSGWSSHFEFMDDRRRRVRCDFVSRPPRVDLRAIEKIFASAEPARRLLVTDVESLILMKRTERAKDYAVIGELAERLPPEREIEFTTNPDRIVALAPRYGEGSARAVVRLARSGAGRRAIVLALADEIDQMQQHDRRRLARYQEAADAYLNACRRVTGLSMPLRETHARLCDLAQELLPVRLTEDADHADAQ